MRFILFLAIGLFFQANIFAQVDSKELQQELEKIQKEMQEQIRSFNFGNLDFEIDTMMLKDFQILEGFDADNFIMPDDIDLDEMVKMLERNFNQMDIEGMMKSMEENFGQLDMSELDKIFEPFINSKPFIIPSPGQSKKENKSKKMIRKKKTWSL